MVDKIGRRKALKVVGASGIAVGSPTTDLSRAVRPKKEFNGVAYHPVTDEILGDATGKIVRTPEKINGVVKISGRPGSKVQGTVSIPFSQDNPDEKQLPNGDVLRKYMLNKNDKFRINQTPSKVQLSSVEEKGISGFLNQPNVNGKVAFTLADEETRQTKDDIVTHLKEDGR